MNRPLPNVPVDEKGLRELEIWLLGQLRSKIKQLILQAGIRFNFDNEGGYLDITTNNYDANGVGMALRDTSGGGVSVQADASVTVTTNDSSLTVKNSGIAATTLDAPVDVLSQGARISLDTDGQAAGGVKGAELAFDNTNPSGGQSVRLKIAGRNGADAFILSDRSVVGNLANLYVVFVGGNHTFYTRTAGNTFEVMDGSGNPIMTLTG